MRIGLSQREESIGKSGHAHDCLEQSWYSLLRNHTLVPIPNTDGFKTFDFDFLILTPGNDSSNRTKKERALFNHAVENNIPVLGVCHGAFFIAKTIGAEIESVEGHAAGEHIVKMDGRNIIVNSFHTETIKSLPDDYEAIAVDKAGNIEGFKHKELPIYGILWHPQKQENGNAMLPEYLDNLLGINKEIFSQNFDWLDTL